MSAESRSGVHMPERGAREVGRMNRDARFSRDARIGPPYSRSRIVLATWTLALLTLLLLPAGAAPAPPSNRAAAAGSGAATASAGSPSASGWLEVEYGA